MSARARLILASAGALLALGVMLGAMGAHLLRAQLSPDELRIYGTAVDYHFYNALGLLGIGAVARSLDAPLLDWAAALILAGVVLFSGSLYGIAFGAPRALGMITPIGGLAMIAGWIVFAIAAARNDGRTPK
jgi:uncharacterized membrane protein YgdD (TMEM256/DUF423 family)